MGQGPESRRGAGLLRPFEGRDQLSPRLRHGRQDRAPPLRLNLKASQDSTASAIGLIVPGRLFVYIPNPRLTLALPRKYARLHPDFPGIASWRRRSLVGQFRIPTAPIMDCFYTPSPCWSEEPACPEFASLPPQLKQFAPPPGGEPIISRRCHVFIHR